MTYNNVTFMTVSSTWRAPAPAPQPEPSYLYWVEFTAGERVGQLYIDLSFVIEDQADVDWLQNEVRARGITGAVVRAFALLANGMGG